MKNAVIKFVVLSAVVFGLFTSCGAYFPKNNKFTKVSEPKKTNSNLIGTDENYSDRKELASLVCNKLKSYLSAEFFPVLPISYPSPDGTNFIRFFAGSSTTLSEFSCGPEGVKYETSIISIGEKFYVVPEGVSYDEDDYINGLNPPEEVDILERPGTVINQQAISKSFMNGTFEISLTSIENSGSPEKNTRHLGLSGNDLVFFTIDDHFEEEGCSTSDPDIAKKCLVKSYYKYEFKSDGNINAYSKHTVQYYLAIDSKGSPTGEKSETEWKLLKSTRCELVQPNCANNN